MITKRHKQIKKQPPPHLHLHLHGPAPLKRIPAPDDQRQVVRAQPRLGVRRVRVRIPRAGKDRAALDPAAVTLFEEREAF